MAHIYRYISDQNLKSLCDEWAHDLENAPDIPPSLKPQKRFIFFSDRWEKEIRDIKAYDSAFFAFQEPIPNDWINSPFEKDTLHQFFNENLSYSKFHCLQIEVKSSDDVHYTDVSVFRNSDGTFRNDGKMAYKDYYNSLSNFHDKKPKNYTLHEVACFSSVPIDRISLYSTFERHDVSDYISNHVDFTNRPAKRLYTPQSCAP